MGRRLTVFSLSHWRTNGTVSIKSRIVTPSGSHSSFLIGRVGCHERKRRIPYEDHRKPHGSIRVSSPLARRLIERWVMFRVLLYLPGETPSGMGFRLGRATGYSGYRAHLFTRVCLPRSSTSPFRAIENHDRRGSRVYRHRTRGATVVRSLHPHSAGDNDPIRRVRRDGHGDQLPVPETFAWVSQKHDSFFYRNPLPIGAVLNLKASSRRYLSPPRHRRPLNPVTNASTRRTIPTFWP